MWKDIGCWGERTSRCTPGETLLAGVQTLARLKNAHFDPTGHADTRSEAAQSHFSHSGSKMTQCFIHSSYTTARHISYYIMLFSHHRDVFGYVFCHVSSAWQQRASLTQHWGRDPEKYPHSREIRVREIGEAGGSFSPLRIPCWQRHFVFLCLVGCELPQVWQAAGVMGDVWQMHISSLERRLTAQNQTERGTNCESLQWLRHLCSIDLSCCSCNHSKALIASYHDYWLKYEGGILPPHGENAFIHTDVGGQLPRGLLCNLEQCTIWFLKRRRVSFPCHAPGEFMW